MNGRTLEKLRRGPVFWAHHLRGLLHELQAAGHHPTKGVETLAQLWVTRCEIYHETGQDPGPFAGLLEDDD